MAHADIDETGTIGVWTEYRDREHIKTIPGSRWDPESKRWHVPLSWGSCKVMRGTFGDNLTVGETLAKWAWNDLTNRVNPCMSLREATSLDDVEIDDRLRSVIEGWRVPSGLNLFPFQEAGVAFMATARQSLLADDMGTGKTAQTIRTLRALSELGEDVFPILIVCPNSMKLTWKQEFNMWWPGHKIGVIQGSAPNRKKVLADRPDIVIVNWESTWRLSRVAPYGSMRLSDGEKTPKELNRVDFKTIIADEAHRMKDPKAKQTRAVWWLGHRPNVMFRFPLSGTPFGNAPDELWSLLHFTAPQDWPAKTKYIDRYALLSWNAFGGMEVIGIRPERKGEFFEILDPRMRRMPKELVLPFLPKKTHVTRQVELPARQRKAYDQMEKTMIAQVDDGTIFTTNPLAQLTRLMQFSSAYSELQPDGSVRLTEPSGKIDEMITVMDELGDEPVVIAAESRQLIELAAARLDDLQRKRRNAQRSPEPYTYRMIVGGMTEDQRDAAKNDFQEGRCRALLFTLKAGGVGLTFTRAGYAIFLQRSWSMLDNKQAEDRVHRIGSEIHDKVVIIDLIAQDTIEEGQVDILSGKVDRLQEILRDQDLLKGLLVR